MRLRLPSLGRNWAWPFATFAVAALLVGLFAPQDPAVTAPDREYVKRVVDGDTLLLGTGERVRLIGVNTPETKHPNKPVEQFGKEAAAFTKRMVEGKLVRIEYDPAFSGHEHKDKFNRTLAYVFLEDGTHL